MEPIPVRDRGYAQPELLAETDWLAGHLNDPKVRVIDTRQPEEYATNHIPGAVNLNGFGGIPRSANQDMAAPDEFASLASELFDSEMKTLKPAKELHALLGSRGITPESEIDTY
jgi:rhodanese-related sulfurtransferase